MFIEKEEKAQSTIQSEFEIKKRESRKETFHTGEDIELGTIESKSNDQEKKNRFIRKYIGASQNELHSEIDKIE